LTFQCLPQLERLVRQLDSCYHPHAVYTARMLGRLFTSNSYAASTRNASSGISRRLVSKTSREN
jgi:hypothetical protein